MHLWRRARPDWPTLVSSVLIVLAFPPWNCSFLIWIALVPWFESLSRQKKLSRAVLQGFWLGFFMSLFGFQWVAYVLHEFGGLPWALSIIAFILFCTFCQPQFLVFAPLRFWLTQSPRKNRLGPLFAMILLGLAYSGIDWVLPKLWRDTLGHSLYSARHLRQIADIGGAHLLTFLVYCVNEAVWTLARKLRDRDEPSYWPVFQASWLKLATAAGLVAAAYAYGAFRLGQVERLRAAAPKAIQMAVIQANIGDFDKLAAETGVRRAAEQILETYYDLSEKALQMSPKPEAIVWPETSYPSTFRTPQTSEEFARDKGLERFVRESGTPLLFGGYDQLDKKDFNAFFMLSPKPLPGLSGEGDLQVYRKSILLLFGEYIPFSEGIPFIRDAFPQVANFGRGEGPQVMRVGQARVGPVICYEVLFPNYVLEAARKGSQVILNITNDSWFGPRGEPELHLALSAFRSIETRLPELRATNTGISALVEPDGEITHATGVYRQEIMNVSVPLLPPMWTLMLAWGDWFGPAALTLSALAIAWLSRRSQQS